MKLVVLCAAGFSSSYVVQAIHRYFEKEGISAEIEADSTERIHSMIKELDAVMLAPSMKYREKEIRELCEQNKVVFYIIDPIHYGRMDGAVIGSDVLALLHAGEGGAR
jgi:PTS system cellobiose-specific IIB component